MRFLHEETVNGTVYRLFDVSQDEHCSDARYMVCIKVPMNNLPGCSSFFNQEVYRSWYKTKKLKSYFPSYNKYDWEDT